MLAAPRRPPQFKPFFSESNDNISDKACVVVSIVYEMIYRHVSVPYHHQQQGNNSCVPRIRILHRPGGGGGGGGGGSGGGGFGEVLHGSTVSGGSGPAGLSAALDDDVLPATPARQGLTLVHTSAQLEPFLTRNTP